MVKQNPCIKQGLCYNIFIFRRYNKMRKANTKREADLLIACFFGGLVFLASIVVFTMAHHGVISW